MVQAVKLFGGFSAGGAVVTNGDLAVPVARAERAVLDEIPDMVSRWTVHPVCWGSSNIARNWAVAPLSPPARGLLRGAQQHRRRQLLR